MRREGDIKRSDNEKKKGVMQWNEEIKDESLKENWLNYFKMLLETDKIEYPRTVPEIKIILTYTSLKRDILIVSGL